MKATEINELTEPFKPKPAEALADSAEIPTRASVALEDQPEIGERSVSQHPSAAPLSQQ